MGAEQKLLPYAAVSLIPATCVLALAPHADDEVFGCGGALALHAAAGAAVKVIVLSDGAFGAAESGLQAAVREAESQAAAAVLGYPPPEFWRLPDRGLEYGEVLIGRLLDAARAHAADLVYAPSLYEVHPDHRALAMAAIEAVRRLGSGVRLAMYEVGGPLRPNLLLDISAVFERKREAMRCFVSQLAHQRYDEHIVALNRYRTYTLPPETVAAEAFELHDAEAIERGLLSIYASEAERQRQCGVTASAARDMPLVSVIIRSMDRPTLQEALDSVALQTYPNIEVVLVNAKGVGHADAGAWCGRFPLRMVGQDGPLRRSRAANLGLDSARGEFLVFLDDDDWFLPGHVAGLVEALGRNPGKKIAYGCVTCVDEDRRAIGKNFCQAFDRVRLLAGNFIPVHAVLFARALVGDGCRFDETLDLYEDWDFWLQLSERGDFLFVNEASAVYRIGQGAGFGVNFDLEQAKTATRRVLAKWRERWDEATLYELTERVRQLDDVRMSEDRLKTELAEACAANQALQAATEGLQAENQDLRAATGGLRAENQGLRAEMRKVFLSRSWRVTRPLRWLGAKLRGIQ